jgi:hypothetical protein
VQVKHNNKQGNNPAPTRRFRIVPTSGWFAGYFEFILRNGFALDVSLGPLSNQGAVTLQLMYLSDAGV